MATELARTHSNVPAPSDLGNALERLNAVVGLLQSIA